MKLRLILATCALVAAPTLGLAMGCSDHGDQASMSCAQGMVLDAATGTCVTQTTS
ncbi:adenylosuccinate lyase [Oceaniglobus trochenteri]|uniref:adenylosuccinate lyase n=1 Tax=Oceaniglobus trochenteri TaxID=2763260 RepID=UPI001CFF5C10|nr:adenylosuccinate lyase [Oceaniglobus trochenteri]